MLHLISEIFKIGVSAEKLDAIPTAEKFRGLLEIDDKKKCASCQTCIQKCPAQAIYLEESTIKIDYKRCLFCGACITWCEGIRQTNHEAMPLLGNQSVLNIEKYIHDTLGRSLHIRHLDVGSCNACDFEMSALSNSFYDIQRFGVNFVASPRHADAVMVTGAVTKNLLQALTMTYECMPKPSLVIAVGACATGSKIFGGSNYALAGNVQDFIPIDINVPGCPPRPLVIMYSLLIAAQLLKQRIV